ncbi:hypothetical protein SAMN05444682_11362 [Parapedobacter indicus]|uniref:Uncharacterized protein n=1 Tax=Parapedobacter indicus TaxID=1477437 RepID=A0A1I3TVP6_9SPHI|nr:hypothetical protein CLV26_11362 [Parapedobacter indicus]SFJ73726.1 hypothetical protein SAMN05444682_11362 [Parapedobacter indicus]
MSAGVSWYQRVKSGLAVAAQAILAAPLKLPPKVVAGARYVALIIGVLDALEADPPERPPGEQLSEGRGEAPPDA